MTPIPLTQSENDLLHFCKGHYGKDFWPLIGQIYKELYAMESDNFQGIYYMIRRLWRKLFAIKGFDDYFLEEYERLSLPENNWQVWGGLRSNEKTPWTNSPIWYNSDILKAKITSMVSQIKLSEIKLWAKLKPSAEFAGLKLVTDESFFTND